MADPIVFCVTDEGCKCCMDRDPILFWNCVALEVHRRDFTVEKDDPAMPMMDRQAKRCSIPAGMPMPDQGGPTRTSRAFAMVHLAAYDAWRSFHPDIGAPYLKDFPALKDFLEGLPDKPDVASDDAAVGAAVSTVLLGLFCKPELIQFIQDQRRDWFKTLLNEGKPAAEVDAGKRFGNRVGAAMLADRIGDGSDAPDDYDPFCIKGTHRPDPFNTRQGFLGPRWGEVRPFGLENLDQLTFCPPLGQPERGAFLKVSARWKDELEEVRRAGAAQDYADLDPFKTKLPFARDSEQTTIGIFWAYDGVNKIGTPPRLYNQCVRSIAIDWKLSTDDNAVLFALVNMAMADAGIAAWYEKYRYDVWRPAIGVREAAPGYGPHPGAAPNTFKDGRPGLPIPNDLDDVRVWLMETPDDMTTHYVSDDRNYHSDPFWRPLGAPQTNCPGVFYRTPPFPAYPSGHATFGAACFETVYWFLMKREKLGDEDSDKEIESFTFEIVSDELNGRSVDPDGSLRSYHKRTLTLPQAIEENAVSRVYLGVHWRMDSDEGVRLGGEIARTLQKRLDTGK